MFERMDDDEVERRRREGLGRTERILITVALFVLAVLVLRLLA
jgi:hypothetical protein